jgi:hypothetical protein
MKSARAIMITVGIISILMATAGLWYNLMSLSGVLSHHVEDPEVPYFFPAYYAMSAICICCYIVLLICGIQFVRLRTGLLGLFVGTVIFEVAYFFSISILWLAPGIGRSVAAATGVANGGIMIQFIILFPLWAPFLAGWAARRI